VHTDVGSHKAVGIPFLRLSLNFKHAALCFVDACNSLHGYVKALPNINHVLHLADTPPHAVHIVAYKERHDSMAHTVRTGALCPLCSLKMNLSRTSHVPPPVEEFS